MARYKFILAYDGTAYSGWQQQPDNSAVSNVLEKKFKEVFFRPISVIGASRTDAGVHALGQVVIFDSELSIEPHMLERAWNNKLPTDLLIRSIEYAPTSFHPQANVKQKEYWYHFFVDRPLPFAARYGFWMRHEIDLKKLNDALQIFVGTHDFRSFCSGEQPTTVRTVDEISVSYIKRFGVYRIRVRGPKFLRYMIRRMVGAALEVSSRPGLSIRYIEEILHAKNPEHRLPNAPAHGLMLAHIEYNEGSHE
ncbi:tRNA pseudouridine(38-40) synthase TruA [Candidatus Dependentiae bacterium]|nr:tRNA pseudouridine(38-40) synthase TruA [Candidatus Dependentiae bacterium]